MKSTMINLVAQPISEKKFAPFGEIITIENKPHTLINNGYTKKYANLTNIDSSFLNGRTGVHLFIGFKRPSPIYIDMLEKHPFSQAFIPKSAHPFIVVVAQGDTEPDIESITSFTTNGKQGINFHRNTWHYPLISSLDDEAFIVIDRADTNTPTRPEQICIEHYFNEPKARIFL